MAIRTPGNRSTRPPRLVSRHLRRSPRNRCGSWCPRPESIQAVDGLSPALEVTEYPRHLQRPSEIRRRRVREPQTFEGPGQPSQGAARESVCPDGLQQLKGCAMIRQRTVGPAQRQPRVTEVLPGLTLSRGILRFPEDFQGCPMCPEGALRPVQRQFQKAKFIAGDRFTVAVSKINPRLQCLGQVAPGRVKGASALERGGQRVEAYRDPPPVIACPADIECTPIVVDGGVHLPQAAAGQAQVAEHPAQRRRRPT